MRYITLLLCLFVSFSAFARQGAGWVAGGSHSGRYDETERLMPGHGQTPVEYKRIDGYWRYTDRKVWDEWGRMSIVTDRVWVPERYVPIRYVPTPGGRAHQHVYNRSVR